MQPLQAILFDLDGTLVDSRPEIVAGLQKSFESVGLPPPRSEEIDIGAPLLVLIAGLLEKNGQQHHAAIVQAFRQDYTGRRMYESSLFTGVASMLARLAAQPGLRLYVATAKAEASARSVLEFLQIAPHFTRIYGAGLKGERAQKTELIAYLLEQEQLRGESCLMVGDRAFDMIGAKTNGVTAVGVTWGYGSTQELKENGADVLVASPADLDGIVQERLGTVRVSA